MKKFLINLIVGTPFESIARRILNKPKFEFDSSSGYWERRYQAGGTSGAGSYGRLADFKAEVINKLVAEKKLGTVIEFGCGDGNQLIQANYPAYIGVDVSASAIALCAEKFSADPTRQFITADTYNGQTAELAMSLDVIYHLVEDDVFENYMSTLFLSATRYVIVYSSNNKGAVHSAEHVKHRCFTDWVEQNAKQFRLIQEIPNPYPFDDNNPDNTSLADFFIFEKVE